MRILDRYIAGNVIIATLLVLAVLVGLDSFMLFFTEMSQVGKAHYSVLIASLYVLMQLPFDMYQLFPMAGFLGCLIGLGRLASQSELIVMRSSGMSIIEITGSVIRAAILMLLVVTFVGEVIAPDLQVNSERIKAAALAKGSGSSHFGGIWLRHKDTFIHLGEMIDEQSASDINIFSLSGRRLLAMSYSPFARRLKQGVWLMSDVEQTIIGQDGVTSERYKTLPVEMKLDPLVLSLGQRSVEQLSIAGLYQSIQYRRHSGLYIEQYQLAFWQRLFQPLATLVMICLGVPFIFGSLRSASMGFRILIGITIGFVFYTLNQLLGPLAIVYQLSPVIAGLIPAIIFIIVCVLLFRRVN